MADQLTMLANRIANHLWDADVIARRVDTGEVVNSIMAQLEKYCGKRERFAEGRDHLTVSGKWQSDRFPWCEVNFVPLKLTDPAARDLLAEYARRREPIDTAFPVDLLEALDNVPVKPNDKYQPFDTIGDLRDERARLEHLLGLMGWTRQHVDDAIAKEQPSDA